MTADSKNLFRSELPAVKTVVVKIGSRILVSKDGERVRSLVDDIAAICRSGVRVVLVSSGAIANGMGLLGLAKRPDTTPTQQACASIGQIKLMGLYSELFSRHAIHPGQVLLTWDDLRDKRRYLNLRNTLFQLLDYGAVPVINENDSVGTEEINFGDNDTLGAQIAMLVDADLYVILTDVDGLYDANPFSNKNAQHIPIIKGVSGRIHALASGTNSQISVGGMSTKLKAAEMVTRSGIHAIIGNGFTRRLLDVVADARCGSLFVPAEKRLSSRQRWLAFARKPGGTIVVDSGAATALTGKGKSLLPAGIKKIVGAFGEGDLVAIQNEKETVIARGLTNYSSADIEIIQGCKSGEIALRLGRKSFDEVVHRDNMVII